MTSSAIPAVEAALLEQLAGHTAEAPIVEGKPEPGPAEFVSLWEAESETEYASLGQQKLNEEIQLMLVVDVSLVSGQNFAPSRERAQAIADAVEVGFREDLTLGGAWRFGRFAKRKQQFFRNDKRRGCRVFLTLSGKAQI